MIKWGVIASLTVIIALGCGERRSVASPGECIVGTGDRVANVYAKHSKYLRFLPSLNSYPKITTYMKENGISFRKLEDIELIGIDRLHTDETVSARFRQGMSVHASVPEGRVTQFSTLSAFQSECRNGVAYVYKVNGKAVLDLTITEFYKHFTGQITELHFELSRDYKCVSDARNGIVTDSHIEIW